LEKSLYFIFHPKEEDMRDKWWAKFLRTVGIVFMSLAAAFTLMGGAGTTCVALNPTGFEGKFSGIAPFQWLWILFVLLGIAIGILGMRAVALLVKGTRHSYRLALISLLLGIVVNAIHLFASRSLRGSSMPVDGVLYTNILTLVIFLLFRLPGVWQGVNFERLEGGRKTGKQASAIAMCVVGLLALTIQFLMAPTHIIGGVNYADVWHIALAAIGLGLILAGFAMTLRLEFTPFLGRSRANAPE
jgi:hypothetical protein